MILHNRINKEELKERLYKENFKRITISFYRYFWIDEPKEFRDKLFTKWFDLNCFGRIYVAREGINAQMSVPEHNVDVFLEQLNRIPGLENMHIKYAVEDDGKSFYKLTIKVREKIVADGLNDGAYDVTNVGNHLSAIEFHNYIDKPDTLVVDMRNHYEYEIGRFKNAYSPDADTFQEAITNAVKELADKKDKRILLYCTGGIRCEKASAFFKHNGFKNVNQLNGGIIEYAQQIKKLELEPKFTGKNFVFDERLGESIDGKVISKCHQCGKPCDNHTNCAHDDCHQLFIQCDDCRKKYDGCCSEECQHVYHLPEEEKLQFRIIRHNHYSRSKIYTKIQKEKLEALKEKSISE
jgi:UPF0176 protein